MYVTDDGIFEPGTTAPAYENGFPCLRGTIRVTVTRPMTRHLARHIEESRSGKPPTELLLIGRSGHAQVGIDIEVDRTRDMAFKSGLLTLPVVISALGPIREPWLHTILQLSRSGQSVRVGRVLLIDWTKRLDRQATQKQLADKFIAAEGAVVNTDGSVSVPIETTEFVADASAFSNAETREQVLIHSRSALVGHQDIRPLAPTVMPRHGFTVLGIRFSSGPCPALIRPDVGGGLEHLRAGLFLDPYRSTRISREYGAMGVRQIELFNAGDRPIDLAKGQSITLDLFPPPAEPSHLLKSFRKENTRVFCHQHGTALSSIIRIEDEATRQAIFAGVTETRDPSGAGDYAKIITPNGVTHVPWAVSPRFQRAQTEHGITNPTGRRREDPSLARAAEALVYSVDQARLHVTHTLPPADELFLLHDLGVKGFVFRAFSPPRTGDPTLAPKRPGPYMTGHLHETMHVLWKSGVSFLYCPDHEDNNVREFHKGFLCRIPDKPRYDEVTTIVNMYGSHSDILVDASRKSVEGFANALMKCVPPSELAFMHGKGRGFMGLADEVARRRRLLSIGVGIDVEVVGQSTNPAPELALDFTSQERAYRQKLMDHLGLFKIFNLGGYGTLEEAAITICSTKLLENMPTPIVFVDETMAKRGPGRDAPEFNENLWQPIIAQATMISDTTAFRFKGRPEIDVAGKPLGQSWVNNILHCAPSYRQAGQILAAFISDPQAYWRKAGISGAEIAFAWKTYLRRMDSYGLKPPDFLVRAMNKS